MSCLTLAFHYLLYFCTVFFYYQSVKMLVSYCQWSVFASAVPTVLAEGRTRNERRGEMGSMSTWVNPQTADRFETVLLTLSYWEMN